MSAQLTTLQQLGRDAHAGIIGEHTRAQIAQDIPNIIGAGTPVVNLLRQIGAALTVILAIGLVVVLMLRRSLVAAQPTPVTEGEEEAPPSSGAYAARWGEIVRHMDSAKETEWKFAIIEADKLIDLVLKRAGFPGDTLGERLTNAQLGQIQTLEGLWQAHKVRNRIAHDLDYFLRFTEAKQAIEQYAASLREFQAI